MTRVVGHRGAAGLAPENTLAAFDAGIVAGADAVECDVHMSRDGQLVVIHDPDVSRTTDGMGNVGQLTLSELRKLNASVRFAGDSFRPQRIPTLADVLQLARGRCAIQIEVKTCAGVRYEGIEQAVVDTLTREGSLDSAQIISFDWETVRRLRRLLPNLPLGLLATSRTLPSSLRRDPKALAALASSAGASFLGLERKYLQPAHRSVTKASGLGIAVWTVNDVNDMDLFVGQQLDAITTDRPDLLRGVLDRRAGST
mgnify:CR=1 FL=1